MDQTGQIGSSTQHSIDIFLVEDDPMVSDFYALILRRQKYTVEQCFTVPEAFAALRTCLPKVAIFDYNIAGHHGLDLYAQCLERKMRFEVLFYSGSFEEHQIEQEMNRTGLARYNFFPKSCHDSEFLEKVRFLYERACTNQKK